MAKNKIVVDVSTGPKANESEVRDIIFVRNEEGDLGCVSISCDLYKDGVLIGDTNVVCDSGLSFFAAARTWDDIIEWAEAQVADKLS